MAIMKRTIALLFALLVSFAAVAAFADQPLAGHWVMDRAHSDDVNRAIDTAVAKMNFVTRPIARGRLRKTNMPYQVVTLAFSANSSSIITDQRAAIVLPASGAAVKWTREDGEVFDVSGKLVNDVLVQTFTAEDGQRVNRWSVGADGKMILDVTVSSPRLPVPLRYKLAYNRG